MIVQHSDGRVLLQLRDDKPEIPYPNSWCLPGGMRDDHEAAVDCAVRELEEEMGLVVAPAALRLIDDRTRSYGHETTFELRLDVDPASIDLTEGQALALFTRDEISEMKLGYDDNEVLQSFFRRTEQQSTGGNRAME